MKLTTWGKALELLRDQRGFNKSELQRRKIVRRQHYNDMIVSKRGPSVSLLDRFLLRMGLTWDDWALALQKARKRKIR